MRYITADYILPITDQSFKEGVIAVNDKGEIQKIGTRKDFPSVDIETHRGVLMPGFINTHCHLELSHMQGLCPTGTKLIPFISTVVKLREFEMDVILEHIQLQDSAMWEAGIQAIGDISNKSDTAHQKIKSPISYYTFVELFDMMQPTMTESTIANYRQVFADQARGEGNDKSFVPHAPYSVTPALFDFINKANPASAIQSIHNTETAPENELFQTGKGEFVDFYKSMGMSLDHFVPPGSNSIDYVLKNLQPKKRNLFVHNTLTTALDIHEAELWSDQVYWVSCPNANLYIENKLPNYQLFLEADATMTLGTDSLMSNWQLSIWEEVKTIKKYQSYVPLTDLMKWATLNGAQALGYAKSMGSLEVGKSPGIVHVDCDWNGDDTDISQSQARRIL